MVGFFCPTLGTTQNRMERNRCSSMDPYRFRFLDYGILWIKVCARIFVKLIIKARYMSKNIRFNYCGVCESFRERFALEKETFAFQFLLFFLQHFLPTVPRSKASKFQFAKSANSPTHSCSNQSTNLIYPRMEK